MKSRGENVRIAEFSFMVRDSICDSALLPFALKIIFLSAKIAKYYYTMLIYLTAACEEKNVTYVHCQSQ